MTIFNLDLDESTEAEIWSALESWGKHFKQKLRERGPARQIHRLNGCLTILTEDTKKMYSYDWLHDFRERDSLFKIESIVQNVA